MVKAFLHHPKQSNKIVLQQIPLLTDNMFHLLILLEKIPGHYFSCWMQTMQQNSGYVTAHNFVKNLNVVNEASDVSLHLTREKSQEKK